MARAIPGARWDNRWYIKSWVIDEADLTPRSAVVIARLFPELMTAELEALRAELLQNARPFDNASDYGRVVDAPFVREALFEEGFDFYHYQAVDLGYLADVMRIHKGGYIAWERGLGKTLAACAIIEDLGVKRILVVAPNTAKLSVWKPEVERFLPGARVRVLPNVKAQRERMLEAIEEDDWGGVDMDTRHGSQHFKDVHILIVHYEALALIAKQRKNWKGWDKYGEWDLVVMDEAHRLANFKTQMHRAAMKVPARYKLALSGSMIQNRPEEVYGVLHWLFPENYSSAWRDWNDRYLEYIKGDFGRILIGPHPARINQMRKELGVFTVYRRKEDELDLPPKTDQTLYVALSPQQRRAYDQLRDEYVAELDSGQEVIAIKPVVMLTRLRQIASGIDLLDESVRDSTKLDLAVELVSDDPDAAYVIFTWYKAAAYSLADRLRGLGEGVHLVTGDTPHTERAKSIAAFQAGTEGRVFVGTISTLGESVNLHRATNAIFIDRSWNPAQNAQAEDRLYRIGQDSPVTISHIVARDTVDQLRVLPTLNEKENLRRMILGG
jgi:SNF2 family DNA or RNA helicase